MDILIADVIGEVALVLIAARLLGAVARTFGQPTVVGQIIAGILLGPSVLGRLPGHLSTHLFPPGALPSLNVLSQVAIVLFMFIVGYELDSRMLRVRHRAGLLVALGGLLVPMGLASGLVLTDRSAFARLGEAHITQSFVLYMAVALSITALPVLAAIIRERGIAGSVAGVTSTTAAGIMDVAAWLVLAAALVGTEHKSSFTWPVALVLIACFGAIMLLGVRPGLRWWLGRSQSLMSNRLPVALILALGSAWVTASLGLHPVFGGFLAGLTMSGAGAGGAPDAEILRPMEDVAELLLPLFFVVTGLSVNFGTLDQTAFILLAFVCSIASLGKLGPAYAASRIGGLNRDDAATVAVLVNTRGLTELIALNVGLTSGLIDQRLFDVLVLMALITTIATAPLLRLVRAPSSNTAVTRQDQPVPPASATSQSRPDALTACPAPRWPRRRRTSEPHSYRAPAGAVAGGAARERRPATGDRRPATGD